MKTLFATLLSTLLCQVTFSLTLVSFVQAAPINQTYLIKPQKIKWGPRNPVSLCNELVMKPKFEITGEGSELHLNFTFQDQKYSVANISTDPDKIIFQYSAETDGKESTSIWVEGKFENDQYNGTAQVKIKKNVSIVSTKDTKKWTPHKYDCDVSYNFQGKPILVR